MVPCYGLSVLLSPQHWYVEILLPSVVLGDGTFGRWHDSRALMKEINAFIEEAPEGSLALSTRWGFSKMSEVALTQPGWHLDFTLLASRTGRYKCLLLEFPLWLSSLKDPTWVFMRIQVQSLDSLNGLRINGLPGVAAEIWCCCGCGVGWQLELQLDPRPGNFHMAQVWLQKRKKKKFLLFISHPICNI